MVFLDEPRRPRRPSTGGKPPVRIREQYVIEEAPSHDDTPCFTAWIRVEIVKIPNGYCSSDYTDSGERPEWSIQIYDTTPGSDSPEHLRFLAEKLHRHTREEREAAGRGRSDRIDVWGMPLATNITQEERIEKCKAHFMAETAARDIAAVDGFHISLLETNSQWQRAIAIIDRPQETWDEGEGGFLVVHWGVKPSWIQLLASVYGEDHQTPETSAYRETLEELGSTLMNIRSDFGSHE